MLLKWFKMIILIYLISIITSYLLLRRTGQLKEMINDWEWIYFKLVISITPIINITCGIWFYLETVINNRNFKKIKPPKWL